MRIFSKKAFQFDHPAGQEASVTVEAQGFADVPDWVAHSAMFKLASKAEEVEVIGSRADELAAGKGRNKKGSKEEKTPAGGNGGGEGSGEGGEQPPAE